MTNETTASQPKITPQEKMPKESIGDDAQAKAWMIWLHGPCGTFENKDDALLEIDRRNKLYPDNNRKILELTAPAAQASATIQAAPDKCQWCPFCGGTKGHWEGCMAPVEEEQDGLGLAICVLRSPGVAPKIKNPCGDICTYIQALYERNPGGEVTLIRVWSDSVGCQSAEDGREYLRMFDTAQLADSTTLAAPMAVASAGVALPLGWELVRSGADIHLKHANGKWGNYSQVFESPAHRMTYEFLDDMLRAATIQEPVMVADPVAYADPKAFENFSAGTATNEWMWAKPDAGLVPLYRAAPMVADPAGVVSVQELSDLVERAWALPKSLSTRSWELTPVQLGWIIGQVCRSSVAATVKAVPSEVLYRDAALEEAAKICEETYVEPGDLQVETCHAAAIAIRALKSSSKTAEQARAELLAMPLADVVAIVRGCAAPLADKTEGAA